MAASPPVPPPAPTRSALSSSWACTPPWLACLHSFRPRKGPTPGREEWLVRFTNLVWRGWGRAETPAKSKRSLPPASRANFNAKATLRAAGSLGDPSPPSRRQAGFVCWLFGCHAASLLEVPPLMGADVLRCDNGAHLQCGVCCHALRHGQRCDGQALSPG